MVRRLQQDQQLQQQQQQQHLLQRQRQEQQQHQQQQQQQNRGDSMQLKNLLGMGMGGQSQGLGQGQGLGHDNWGESSSHLDSVQREDRFAQQQQRHDQQLDQWVRENASREREKASPSLREIIQDGSATDSHFGSSSRGQGQGQGGSWPIKIGQGQIGQIGQQIGGQNQNQQQNLGQNQNHLGLIKPINGSRVPVYAQAPPPLGAVYAQAPPPLGKKSQGQEMGYNMPSALLDWSENQLGIFARGNREELREVLEYCYKLENPAEIRDFLISRFGSTQQVSTCCCTYSLIN